MKFVFFITSALLFAAQRPTICDSTYEWLGTLDGVSWERRLRLFETSDPQKLGESKHSDNVKFVEGMDSADAINHIYLHITLKPLKELNDKIFDGDDVAGKNDVNAARNMFRVMFIENLRKSEMLSQGLHAQFVDFKTTEVDLDPSKMRNPKTGRLHGPSAVQKEIDRVWAKTQIEYSDVMGKLALENPDLMNRIVEQGGLASDLRAWHILGMSFGSADLAATAARQTAKKFNRESGLPLKAHLYSEEEMQAHLAKAETVNKAKLLNDFGPDSPLFTRYENTEKRVLSLRAIDLLRKVKAVGLDEYVSVVQQRFKDSLDVFLTREQVIALRDYYSASDDFQPTLRSVAQGEINLTKATEGAMSIDFSGQNVVNMYHTMGAMARAGNAREAIAFARDGEKLATVRLKTLREDFDFARQKAGILGEYQITGDDGMVIVKKPPTEAQVKALYRALKVRGAALADFRIVVVPPVRTDTGGLDPGGISREAVKGENFEKRMREKLFAAMKTKFGQDPYSQLRNAGISIEMTPDSKKVKVILATEDPAVVDVLREVLKDRSILPEGYASSGLTLAL